MKDFAIKITSLVACLLMLIAYNVTLELRSRNEDIARLTAELEAASKATVNEESGLTDGTYRGEAQGYSDLITVDLTIKEGKISEIKIVSAPGEDSAYLGMAETLIPAMIEAQETKVDTISGATMSSVGIINAASIALNKAISN